MTEIEYGKKIKPTFQAEQFEQLELLYEVFILRNIRKKLRKKLKSLEKMVKGEINKEINKKVEAFKIVSMENNVRFKELLSRLKLSYNIFKYGWRIGIKKIKIKCLVMKISFKI